MASVGSPTDVVRGHFACGSVRGL